MSGYLIAALPWFTGGLICLALVGRPRDAQYLQRNQLARDTLPLEFLFGLGGLLGYLAWGYGLWAADQFGLTLLSSRSVVFLSLLVTLAAFLINKNNMRRPTFRGYRVADLPFVLLLSGLLSVALYLQHMTPLFAWDGLNHWAWNAAEFIQKSQIDWSGTFNDQYRKHPPTVVMIAAWTGWSMQLNDSPGWGTPWVLCMISLCFMTAGFIRALTGGRTLALLGAVLTATVPLAESHTLIAGYAELWLAAVVIAGLLLFGLGLEYQRKSWIFTGVFMGALAMTIKNTGPGYALCVWGALVSSWLIHRPKLAALVSLSFGAAAYGLWVKGFLFDWAGVKIQWIPATQKLELAGQVRTVDISPIEQVTINELYSLLGNQSFSTAALALLFAVIAITCPHRRAPHELSYPMVAGAAKSLSGSTVGAQPLLFGALLILTMLILVQLFLPYGYNLALPGSDTGNSRFSLPLILSVIPAAIVMVHALMNKPRR